MLYITLINHCLLYYYFLTCINKKITGKILAIKQLWASLQIHIHSKFCKHFLA